MTTVKELLDFFKYLDRRGFLREDLQCNPEHHVMVYLRDFYNGDKPTETQYVDLGLPSGTLWATCNVGANKPEEYGDHFTWGEAMHLGVTLPTKEQIIELYSNCAGVWTAQNGKNGRMFAGPNGNTLFLPAAGGYNDGILYCEGSGGRYWSSRLCDIYPDEAYYLRFGSDYVGWNNYYHYCRMSVRAVKNKEE